jgi:hypothetical protein
LLFAACQDQISSYFQVAPRRKKVEARAARLIAQDISLRELAKRKLDGDQPQRAHETV